MKKNILLFLILTLLNLFSLPVLPATNNTIKKPLATTFNNAVKKGDVEKVEAYLKAGFNPNKKYWTTWLLYGTPVIGTAISSKQNRVLDLLLESGASPNPKTLIPPLHVAVMCNNSYAVKRLLQAGANPNATCLNNTAPRLAMARNNTEIMNIFNDFNNTRFANATKIEDALNLLNTNPVTKGFYQILKGENKKGKAFIITYSPMIFFYKKNISDNILASTHQTKENYYIYINENYRNSSKEALATLIASQTLHMDLKDSINEEAYSALTMATVWNTFTTLNPELRNENSILIATLNEYENDLINNDFDIAKFKNKIVNNPTYISLKLPVESPGFTNDLLDLPKDKNLYDKTKLNLQKYWNSTTTSEKVYNVCYFVAYTSVVIGISILLNSSYSSTIQQSTFTSVRINSF